MDNEGHDDLIDEVADALTLRQDVDWDRCARLVTPSNRWLLENLRVIARVAAGLPRIRERVADTPAAIRRPVRGGSRDPVDGDPASRAAAAPYRHLGLPGDDRPAGGLAAAAAGQWRWRAGRDGPPDGDRNGLEWMRLASYASERPQPGGGSADFRTPDAKITSLSRASTIVSVPETASGSLRVHPNCRTRVPAMRAVRTKASYSGHEGGTR